MKKLKPYTGKIELNEMQLKVIEEVLQKIVEEHKIMLKVNDYITEYNDMEEKRLKELEIQQWDRELLN